MFRLPKSSNQSSKKKHSNTAAEPSLKLQGTQGLCKFSHRKCNFLCIENYDYCLKHILEDKSAPYKPCLYLYTVSGKKCGKPALRQGKDTWFCAEHNRKTQLQKQRASSRHAPPKTQEALFATLGHYVPSDKAAVKREETESEDSSGKEDSKAVDPFVDIDASKVNNRVNQVLEYVSESDSDVEMAMLDSVWRAQDQESSDAESVDSQNEDPLKHAGTYTAEEVTIIIKDKMLRLQSLYIDQFRRLQHLLKEKRRKYLHALKKEKETLCSIHDQEKQTAKEQKLYEKLKALNRYHKHHGVEAILHKKALELRTQITEGHQLRTSHKGKCAFTEGGVKCGAKTLPVTKYCRKHILEDTQQVLFRSCGVKRDDHVCQEPTLNVFENATCVYHTVLPVQPHDKFAKLEQNENQLAEGDNVPILQDDRSAFVNDVDSEELLIKNILKPTGIDSSGKPESVDALELSRTVSDILALAEAHNSAPLTTDLGQITDKSFIEQNIEASSNAISTSVFDQGIGSSSKETTEPVTDLLIEALPAETSKTITNQNLNTLSSENVEPVIDSCADVSSNKPVIDNNTKVSSNVTFDLASSGVCEKMDMEDEKQSISTCKEFSKEEHSQDLMMVDMVTDVGVVEEVLDTEQEGVDLAEEEVISEQELEGSKKEASSSDQPAQVSGQKIKVSDEQEKTSEEQEDGTEPEKSVSEQNLVESDKKKRVTEYQVVSEHHYADISCCKVPYNSSTDQEEAVVSDHKVETKGVSETEMHASCVSSDSGRKAEKEEPMEVDCENKSKS